MRVGGPSHPGQMREASSRCREGSASALRLRKDRVEHGWECGSAQGLLGGVRGGVQVAGLEGHVSRSAVYLVHRGLGRRLRMNRG